MNSNMHVNKDTLDNITDFEDITIKVKLISDLKWVSEKDQPFLKNEINFYKSEKLLLDST